MLTVAILGSTLVVPLIYLDFEVRQDYIAKVLCIEKEEPMTICAGSCYLAAQLKKAKSHEEERETANQIVEINFFFQLSLIDNLKNGWTSLEYQKVKSSADLFCSAFVNEIFQPPRLA